MFLVRIMIQCQNHVGNIDIFLILTFSKCVFNNIILDYDFWRGVGNKGYKGL